MDRSIEWWMYGSMDRWMDWSNDLWIDRWIDRCIDRWINWLIDWLINRWIDGWFDRWVLQDKSIRRSKDIQWNRRKIPLQTKRQSEDYFPVSNRQSSKRVIANIWHTQELINELCDSIRCAKKTRRWRIAQALIIGYHVLWGYSSSDSRHVGNKCSIWWRYKQFKQAHSNNWSCWQTKKTIILSGYGQVLTYTYTH